MIAELLTAVRANYAINSQADAEILRTVLLERGLSREAIETGIEFHKVPHGDFWMRDTGGTFNCCPRPVPRP